MNQCVNPMKAMSLTEKIASNPTDHDIRDAVEQALLARALCLQNIRDDSRTWDDERIEREATDLARYCRMRRNIIKAVIPLR